MKAFHISSFLLLSALGVFSCSEKKAAEEATRYLTKPQIEQKVRDTRKLMEIAAKDLNFLEAASLRDQIKVLKEQL